MDSGCLMVIGLMDSGRLMVSSWMVGGCLSVSGCVRRQPHAPGLDGPQHELGQRAAEASGTTQAAPSTLPRTLSSRHTQLHRTRSTAQIRYVSKHCTLI